jgi:hypothetical protein
MTVMAHCKNIRGGPENDERRSPCLTEQEKVKGPKKTVIKKKCKRGDIEAERVAVVAIAAERAERGGRGSGIHVGKAQFHLEGRELGTDATE